MALLALLPALAPTWRTRLAAALARHAGGALARVRRARSRRVPRRRRPATSRTACSRSTTSRSRSGPARSRSCTAPCSTAIFAFCLVVSLGLAARRPLVAAFGLVAGAAWPATLVGAGNRIGLGALILAGVLSLLAWGGRRPAQSPRPALLAGAAVVLAAVAAGAQPAVAKGEFLGWKGWDPYDQPADPVGVDYVWDASYDGIQFPSEPTDVLTVDRAAARRSTGARGSSNEFRNGRWVEAPSIIAISDGAQDLSNDPFLPVRARDHRTGSSARASRSRRSATTTSSRRGRRSPSIRAGSARSSTATATSPSSTAGSSGATSTRSGATCRARARASWRTCRSPSTDRATPSSRTSSRSCRATRCRRSGRTDRQARVLSLAENERVGGTVRRYLPLYRRAQSVTRGARTQYAVVIALESWFRSGGGFRYTETPPACAPGRRRSSTSWSGRRPATASTTPARWR